MCIKKYIQLETINGLETHPPLLPLSTMEEAGVQVLSEEMIEEAEVDLPSGWILLATTELEMTDVAGTFLLVTCASIPWDRY
jgi:hypothetical protein